ncbi:MAG TPA: aldehyde dehydrogenase family protein [Jatrophihabitans sp.]|jgi:aldehyde dehydrogenase (NAD+)
MATTVANLIGGRRCGEPVRERRNPAHPDQVVSVAPESTIADIDAAVDAAEKAQPEWAARAVPARGGVLLRAADRLRSRQDLVVKDLIAEEGKTQAEASGEVNRAIDILSYVGALGWQASGDVLPSGSPDTMIYTRREPFGVVAAITPWNFPIAIPTWKLAPALLAGNAAVLKPAELTPRTALHLAEVLEEAGLPPGVLNIVHGTGSVVGARLAEHPDVGALSFTGSTAAGLAVERAVSARRGRVQVEMGGKNAVLVLDDADVAAAARVVAAGAFGLTGQACTATSRIFATPGVIDAFTSALVELTGQYRPGDGMDPSTGMGPVVSQAQLDKNVLAIDTAVREGGTLRSDPAVDGQLFGPVVVDGLDRQSALVREEVFGPVVAIVEVADLAAGVEAVNDSRYGLAAGICTTSLAHAQEFARRARAGVIKVNRPTSGLDLNAPFGGVGESSSNTFREQGAKGIDFYTWSKSVYLGWDGV